MATRARRVVVNAMLIAVALTAVPEVLGAQDAMGGAAVRGWERRSAQAESARHARDEQYRRIEREQAHAQMPATMYASTPDPAPPHPFLLDAGTESTPERSDAPVSARAEVRLGHRVGLFPSSSRWTQEKGYQGFVRVINRSDDDGEVRIDAWDDAGEHAGPVTLAIGMEETKHFNSEDLEAGNAGKGLEGSTGPGEGDWRLEFTSTLDIEVLGYIRTGDGFLTSMHDVAPATEAGHRVVMFNPGSNVNQASRLRVVNPGAESAEVRIEGTDDDGVSSHGAVEFTLAAGESRTLSAKELESGEAQGVSSALGTGEGKWRLRVTAKQPIEVLSLLWSPTGHLTNLSTVPDNTGLGEDGVTTTHSVALFPSASDPLERQGFVRVVNRSDQAGEVRIDAWDDDGTRRGPVTLAIGAHETKHFNSDDLEGGNPGKGLDGSTGSGEGGWRLVLTSPLELEVLAYIRTEDGFLTSMHDVAPSTGAEHRVVTFNPGRNDKQVSKLRLINPGAGAAEVRIEGTDDDGRSSDGAVEFTLAPVASRTFTAQELESGAEAFTGTLGTGTGKWQLLVTAEQPLEVMSLLSSPTGHLTNLSTVRGKVALGVEETAAEVFREYISGPIVQGKCIACHVAGGVSGHTELVFVPSSAPDHEARNLQTFRDFFTKVEDGASYILNKIQGVAHGGGVQVAAGTADYENIERFLGLLGEDVTPVTLTPQTLFDTVRMAPLRKTLRRAALIFAGRRPSDEEYAAAQRGGAAARETIRGLMTGPQFHEFLIRAANDRLLTDRDLGDVIGNLSGPFVDFINEYYRRVVEARDNGQTIHVAYDWNHHVQHGARRAPLELIAHVAENDLPYTEVLTADYLMANPWSAAAYGASTRFDDPEDLHEFKPSRFVTYYREGDGYESEYDPVLGATRVINPGPLITDYPHAGILNTTAFLRRYPTTATNRNRARSRWTYYHFLGHDIEKSASRTTDPVALADTNNPTLRNPACTVCHRVLDPVAGAFQNFGDDGEYKDQWGGLDSLDEFYKRDDGSSLAIRADSWEDRETLSWPIGLAAGVETLRVVFTNDFYDEATGDDGMIYLDRLRVVDSRGLELVSHEFETLGPPIAPWGPCGERRRNPVTRSEDHIVMWNGYLNCAYFIDVDIPSDGIHNVEIVAWADRHEQYEEDRYAKLSVVANKYVYQDGDTWYRDMRSPGFAGALAPSSDNSTQWLAKQIVADERFAEATVEFWWPAIMGSEVAEPPEDEEDVDFEGRLLAANAQDAEVSRLAGGFRRGFRGRAAYNLKDLLVEIVLSKWFRADAVEDANPVRHVALRDAGARRLLTPEEIARKTAAVTGVQWERHIGTVRSGARRPSALTEEYRLLYGGIDSDGITERARDMTSVMAGVARRQAAMVSCPVVMRELYLLPEADRKLFAGIDRDVTPGMELGASFEVEAGSRSRRETLSLSGTLTAGPTTVKLSHSNDYNEPNAHRNLFLDRLMVRNAAGRIIARRELETLRPSGNCNDPHRGDYALWCSGWLDVPIDIPAAGNYEIDIVAWASHAGDELPRLSVVVESETEGSGAGTIRAKLVELFDKLLGVQVTPHSPDVEAAFRLFAEVMERGREAQKFSFRDSECYWNWLTDLRFFEGILDDALVQEGEPGWGHRWFYDFNRPLVEDFMNGIDWSDPHYAAQAWAVVLAYLLTDYRYLYQ